MHSVMDYDPMLLESRLPYPKTLDKTVLVARAQEVQKVLLPEKAALENIIDVDSPGCIEVTEKGGVEAAPFDLSHSSELGATSEHGDGARTESAEEQGPNTVTVMDGKGRIIGQQHEGSDGGSPSKSRAGGSHEVRANAKAGGEKKRKGRSKNWNDEETEILLKAVRQKKKIKSRFDKRCGGEPLWEDIAKEVAGRTGKECRMRMDTMTKSYKAIKGYCEKQKKEFTELKEEDFGNMKLAKPKLATRLTESWYNHIRDHCLPLSNKKTRNRGQAGISSGSNQVPVLCASTSGDRDPLPAGFHNPVAESTKVAITTPDGVTQSKPQVSEAFEVVVEETTWSWVGCVDRIQVWTRRVTISNGGLRKCRECGSNSCGQPRSVTVRLWLIIVCD